MMSDFMKLIPVDTYDDLADEVKKLKKELKYRTEELKERDCIIEQLEKQYEDLVETSFEISAMNDELSKKLVAACDVIDNMLDSNNGTMNKYDNASPEDIARFWFDGAGNPHPKVHTDRDYDCFDYAPTVELSKEKGLQIKNVGKIKLPSKVSLSKGNKGLRIRFE